MSEFTTLQVKKTTRNKLKKLKITKRESYDEIILRLMDNQKEVLENE